MDVPAGRQRVDWVEDIVVLWGERKIFTGRAGERYSDREGERKMDK